MKRFIFASAVAIEASTIEDAYALMEGTWDDDGHWHEIAQHIEVFAPGGEPDDIEDPDDGPICTCPPDLAARGGFTSRCGAH